MPVLPTTADDTPARDARKRERPILGPVRCVCDEPLQPFRVVDGGMWGTLACRRCARLLMNAHQQPRPSEAAAAENMRAWLETWKADLAEAHHHRSMFMFALHPMRERTGLSLRTVAQRAGISSATLSLAERGELDFSPDTATRVLDVLAAARAGRSPGRETA